VNRGASFQPVATALEGEAPAPAPASAPSMAQGSRPFLQRSPAPGGESVFRVSLRCRMGDGSEYVSVYDAVMPQGAQPMNLEYTPLS